MEDRLAGSRRLWDDHARFDPLWAVLSDPDETQRRWDLRAFMKTGEREIALLMLQLSQIGVPVARGRALDFGCGVGRLTQALARRFEHTVGVDVSPRMIDLASRINPYGSRAEFRCNADGPFSRSSDAPFDLVYSNITLQHVPPEMSREYIGAFLDVLAPGGVAVFQVPSHREPTGEPEIRPMSGSAYVAEISLISPVDDARVASRLSFLLRVKNASPAAWRQPEVGSIRLGNHWFDASGTRMLVQDDGRSTIPQVVEPGSEFVSRLEVTAPPAPGSYVLEFDVVHEGVTWFAGTGSPTVRVEVRVVEGVSSPVEAGRADNLLEEFDVPDFPGGLFEPSSTPGEPPDEFPMYAVPQPDVLGIIDRSGASLVHLERGFRAGSDWIDYRYFVVRR